jgi:hypothetical protein
MRQNQGKGSGQSSPGSRQTQNPMQPTGASQQPEEQEEEESGSRREEEEESTTIRQDRGGQTGQTGGRSTQTGMDSDRGQRGGGSSNQDR